MIKSHKRPSISNPMPPTRSASSNRTMTNVLIARLYPVGGHRNRSGPIGDEIIRPDVADERPLDRDLRPSTSLSDRPILAKMSHDGHPPTARDERSGPWFRHHPRTAAGVAAAMFVGVFAVRMSVDGTREAISVLYVLPIALLAMAFGLRTGLAAGTTGVGLLAIWVLHSGAALSPLGWLSRATPLLVLGALIGVASDRLREAAERERRAAAVAMLQRDAAEVHDELVQALAVTKWVFESGDSERGLAMLEENLVSAQALVSRMLGSGSALPGDLRRSRADGRSPMT